MNPHDHPICAYCGRDRTNSGDWDFCAQCVARTIKNVDAARVVSQARYVEHYIPRRTIYRGFG